MTAPAFAPSRADVVLLPRNWKAPIILGIVALTTLLGFGLFGNSDEDVRFVLTSADAAIALDPIVTNAKALAIVLGVLSVGGAIFSAWRVYLRQRSPLWISLVVGLFFLVGLVAWVGAGGNVPVVFLLTGALSLSAAIVYGSLAGVIGERVGVVNIAIEGQLLMGAFVSAVVASITGNFFLALVAACAGGALVSMVLASFSIKYLVDQIIVGVVLNVLVIGLTNFLFAAVLSDNSAALNFPGTLPFIAIPGLSEIPVIGPVLFNNRITTYLLFILVPLVWFMLFKTRWGLRVRALGEHPLAADTVGISVNRTRFWTVTLAGCFAGLGGAALTIGSVGAFVREMSAGQGYIALAAVILGRWNPWLAAGAALLFGFTRNFRIWAGQAGSAIPPDLIAMAPYLVTLIAVAVLVGRAVGPRAVGKPYVKE
ncbi:MAG: ABC transporter permease [Microbacteriaceae bacterium]